MAEMEQALGGEYVFDRAFLESSVREQSSLAYQVVYSLNAMSQNQYVGLFDRFQSIKSILDDILTGGLGPFAASLTLPYSALGWEMEPLAGTLNVCLAEARLRLDISAPDGFAVTTTGWRLFMEANGIIDALEKADPEGVCKALENATLPPELERAIAGELKKLQAGSPTIKRLSVRACGAGDQALYRPDFASATEAFTEDTPAACKRIIVDHIAKSAFSKAPSEHASQPFALAVHEAVQADVVGFIRSEVSARFPAGLFSITAAPVGAHQRTEHYLLRKVHPFDLVQWDSGPPSMDQPLVSVSKALSRSAKGFYRGSSLLEPAFLKAVAESAMSIERRLGCVRELHWAKGSAERPVFFDIRQSLDSDGASTPACAIGDELKDARILLNCGTTVQSGISAGCGVHVPEDYDLELFPHGAVAIARVASPRLSPVLRRASAIVTELGSSASHLATVARELRVPAIFGASEALKRIPDGLEVTVDAGERIVYGGIVEPLLACRECSSELYPSDPEYVSLRRLLRWIMPLDLIDPESEEFTAANCRTYHDIIHFAHERSVEELLHIQDRGRGLALRARKMDLGLPVDLFVIDLGGGISSNGTAPIVFEEVVSEPFRAFLRGFGLKDMWSGGPGSIRLRDILSGLDRTFAAMTTPPEYGGMNHAIVGQNYMNVGLRLGYHFSVVDAYLGANVSQNYIYFRFVGGFADDRRRRLRAELIRTLLEEMHFKVTVKGDLVVGKLKIAAVGEITAALKILGELTGFTRQLDLSMSSEEKVKQFASLFREKSVYVGDSSDGEEPVDA
jgi:pyruvate,water dikinase